ncbi:class I SAM-dependent methyltransferase, partial [Parasphingorhabdus sp.]|uniref:class I SAM-dependent methyltransferase n=1 Tax=Parasphingorhabdus sp. TaxID=2709688 RepID=UPI003C7127A7
EVNPVQLPSGIWSCFPEASRSVAYDSIAAPYDWLVGNTLYNRIAWGGWSDCYSGAAREAIRQTENSNAAILDCGCGTLKFTAEAYKSGPLERMKLFDSSIAMMARGKKRLPGGYFVQGDALDTPFVDKSFGFVLSWGLLHLFGSNSQLLPEFYRVMQDGGKLFLSVLVKGERGMGDIMLNQLHKRGEISEPESRSQYEQSVGRYFRIDRSYLSGSMLFISASK